MPRAARDLAALYKQIDAGQSEAALMWYRGIKKSILSLEESPERCPITPENSKLRHLFHGHKPHVYRVIYRLLPKQNEVQVIHVRNGAMDRFKN